MHIQCYTVLWQQWIKIILHQPIITWKPYLDTSLHWSFVCELLRKMLYLSSPQEPVLPSTMFYPVSLTIVSSHRRLYFLGCVISRRACAICIKISHRLPLDLPFYLILLVSRTSSYMDFRQLLLPPHMTLQLIPFIIKVLQFYCPYYGLEHSYSFPLLTIKRIFDI